MKIKFKCKENLWFEYVDTPENLPLTRRGKVNLTGLYLYGIYRNTLFDSYKAKQADLAADIRDYPKVFAEHPLRAKDSLYNDPVYHYSVAACLEATREWLDPQRKIHSYVAYEQKDNGTHKKIVGFVHFVEEEINGEPLVYIAQAAAMKRSAGIGNCLMECVLSHYPENTLFIILTRVFNHDAKKLYHEKLHFSPIGVEKVRQMGYDERYCGFEHTTSVDEIKSINDKKVLAVDHPEENSSAIVLRSCQ